MTQAASPRKGHRFTPAKSISCINIVGAVEVFFFPETLLALTYFVQVLGFFPPLGEQTN